MGYKGKVFCALLLEFEDICEGKTCRSRFFTLLEKKTSINWGPEVLTPISFKEYEALLIEKGVPKRNVLCLQNGDKIYGTFSLRRNYWFIGDNDYELGINGWCLGKTVGAWHCTFYVQDPDLKFVSERFEKVATTAAAPLKSNCFKEFIKKINPFRRIAKTPRV